MNIGANAIYLRFCRCFAASWVRRHLAAEALKNVAVPMGSVHKKEAAPKNRLQTLI